MALEPIVVTRAEQPYVSITSTVTMRQLGEVLPPLAPQLLDWAARAGLEPTGPVFWKYNVIDMAAGLEVEVGVPVDRLVSGDDRVQAHVLPLADTSSPVTSVTPDSLEQATAELLAWADEQGLSWDITEVAGEERWAARLEEYLNGPDDQPDLDKWETNLVFRLAQ